MTTESRRIYIPACAEHAGVKGKHVTVDWICPVCGEPRGEVKAGVSWDGSRRLYCDTWSNPCGHVDKYSDVRKEAAIRERARMQAFLEVDKPSQNDNNQDVAPASCADVKVSEVEVKVVTIDHSTRIPMVEVEAYGVINGARVTRSGPEKVKLGETFSVSTLCRVS